MVFQINFKLLHENESDPTLETCGSNRLVLSSLTKIIVATTIRRFFIAHKSDLVFGRRSAVLCFSWNAVTRKWITKEEGKVRFLNISVQPEVSVCN